MIRKRSRHHKINTGQGTYESMDLGATIEWDDEVDTDVDPDAELDDMLDEEINRVLGLPGIIQESHVFDFYNKD